MTERDELERISVHEAAHAVAAWLLGGVITGPVSVLPKKHWRGVAFCRARRIPLGDFQRMSVLMPSAVQPPRWRRQLEVDAIIALAGPAAERLVPVEPVTGYEPERPVDEDALRGGELAAVLTRSDARLLEIGDDDDANHRSDGQNAHEAARSLAFANASVQLRLLELETEAFVRTRRFRHLTGVLAAELVAHTTLSARSVRRVLREAEERSS